MRRDGKIQHWVPLVIRAAVVLVVAVIGAILRNDDDPGSSAAAVAPSYEADFPMKSRALIHPGVDVYYFSDAVGEVTEAYVRDGRVQVRFTIDPDFAPQFTAMPSTLRGYRSREDPTKGWVTIIPQSSDGRSLSPREAARIWGTGV